MKQQPPPSSEWHRHHARRRARRHGWRRGKRHRPYLFWRFAFIFGFMAWLFLGSLIAIAALILRLPAENAGAMAIAVAGVLVAVALLMPIMAIGIGRRAFKRIAAPLADVMEASEAIASGDLAARVASHPGEFAPLANAFNHMAVELERSDEQRRNLTADVAHELRTPLHIIQGNLEGILDGVYQPSEAHIAETLEETRLLSRLVDDLQLLSNAETGQLSLSMDRFAAADLLSDAMTSFSGLAAERGVDLQAEMPASDLMMGGDFDRISQILNNLLVNALRHTPTGGQIRLKAKLVDDAIQLSVSDTGEGIPAADLPYIFDRFWRGDKARSGRSSGNSGLGLAIARQLAQAHGGEMWADSQVGVGSTFVASLPA